MTLIKRGDSWQIRSWDMSSVFSNGLMGLRKSPIAMHHSVMYSPPGITAELFKTNLYFWLRLARSYTIPHFDFFSFTRMSKLLAFSWITFYLKVLCFLCISLYNLNDFLSFSFIQWVIFVLSRVITKENLPLSQISKW